MKVPFVDLLRQYDNIKGDIDQAISNVINDTAFIRGKYVEEFEKNFAKEIGVAHCLGVGNGTDAITIALKALNIGSGDEVITVANSFVASSEAITNAGARVVFVDCDESYNMDVSQIESILTGKTKAIVPVHLYGQPADMDAIMKIAHKHDLYVIEDCAQAHFAECIVNGEKKKTGTIGHAASFSFYPGKNLGAYGDAGAVVTNDDKVAVKAKMVANHGRVSKYDHEFEGLNSRMDGLQGAILNVKLKYLDTYTNNRIKVSERYTKELTGIGDIICPNYSSDKKHVFHLYVIRTKNRDGLMEFLKEKGVSVGIHYPIALPYLAAYKYLNHKEEDFPMAYSFQNEILSLPIFPEISDEEIQYVIDSVKEYFQN